jgi:sugar-phosphatase
VIRRIAPHLSPSEELKRFQDAAKLLDQSAVRAIPGAAEVIAVLPRDRWALVTSAPRGMARERLVHAGLPVPEVLISADDVRAGKPDPEGFLAAAKRLNAEPSRCLVFEDAPAGLEAARRAGMRSIALTTTHTREQLTADYCIPDYSAVRVSYSDASGIVVAHRN